MFWKIDVGPDVRKELSEGKRKCLDIAYDQYGTDPPEVGDTIGCYDDLTALIENDTPLIYHVSGVDTSGITAHVSLKPCFVDLNGNII